MRFAGVCVMVFVVSSSLPASAKQFKVNGDAGNSTMSAVFDAPLGERISAISSSVSCDLDIDPKAGAAKGKCAIPLTAIMVDGDATKTDHFYQWATNKSSDPLQCAIELSIDSAKTNGALEANKPSAFRYSGVLTVCGRGHDKSAKEIVDGTVVLLPVGTYGDKDVVKIRAKIEKFNREAYHIGAKWTDGWLAKVQQLANVVAPEGTIEVNLFARATE